MTCLIINLLVHLLILPVSPSNNQRLAKDRSLKDIRRIKRVAKAPVGEQGHFRIRFLNEKFGLISDEARVWRTKDGGKNWVLIFAVGVYGSDKTDRVFQVELVDARIIWMNVSFKLYKTEDGGESWKRLRHPLQRLSDGSFCAIKFLSDGKHGWIAGRFDRRGSKFERDTAPNRFILSGDGKVTSPVIYHTTDGGRTWRVQARSGGWGIFCEVEALDSKHAWASGEAGLYYLDRGKWNPVMRKPNGSYYERGNAAQRVEIGFPTIYPFRIHFFNSRIGWVSNGYGQVARSVDGGKSWRAVTDPKKIDWVGQYPWSPCFTAFQFFDAHRGYAWEGMGAMHETKDGGRSWRRLNIQFEFSSVYFRNNRTGWGVANGGIYRIYPPAR